MEDTGGAAQFDNATVDSALREAITDQDVDAVRRLLATPGYRFPATPTAVFSLVAAQSVTVGHGQSAHADPPNVCRRRGRDMLLALVAACDEDALCRRTLHRKFVDLDRDEAVTKVRQELIFPGITALHHFAWNGDVEAVQTILDLPQCTERVLNTGTGEHERHDVIPDRDDDDHVTALHVACAIGRPAVVRAILRDGRADLTLVSVDEVASTALVFALDSLRFSGCSTTKFLPRSLADCVRALITKDPRLADVFYRVCPGMLRHAVKKVTRLACLEVLYLMLAALPQINRFKPVLTCGEPVPNPELESYEDFQKECSEAGLEGLLARVGWGHYSRSDPNRPRDGTWPCTVFLLECVNAGSFKAWRAEKAREMLFLRRLFTRQHRRASCADLSLMHRLFLLRDDALFLRCLEYCWFLDPWKRYPSETDYRRVFETAATESES
jgi:hypothetical protein